MSGMPGAVTLINTWAAAYVLADKSNFFTNDFTSTKNLLPSFKRCTINNEQRFSYSSLGNSQLLFTFASLTTLIRYSCKRLTHASVTIKLSGNPPTID